MGKWLTTISLVWVLFGISGCKDAGPEKTVDRLPVPAPEPAPAPVQDEAVAAKPSAPAPAPESMDSVEEPAPATLDERPVVTVEQPMLLKDTQGREIEAEVKTVTEESVALVRVDNQEAFTIPLTAFSDETQSMLQLFRQEKSALAEWQAAHAPAEPQPVSGVVKRPVISIRQPMLLKDRKGREVEVEVKTVTQSSVSLVRVDTREEVTIPLNVLSEESQSDLQVFRQEQAALAAWKAAHPQVAAKPKAVARPSGEVDVPPFSPVVTASDVAGYFYAKVPDFRAHAKRLQATPLSRSKGPFSVAAEDGSISLTIRPDAAVELKRDGKTVSSSDACPWSVYHWTGRVVSKGRVVKEAARYPLNNMRQLGPNELLLWSEDGRFRALVAITGESRYIKFELIHLSNDPGTGSLTGDWQGHRVEFQLSTAAQNDGWKLNTMLLNPMSELGARAAVRVADGITFWWPYSIWSQTDDRPQPQGMIAVYGFAGDEQHDDIMMDIWAEEPSLPRPNRAVHSQWTRREVEAWLDQVVAFHTPARKMFSFEPAGDPESFYQVADLAVKYGISAIGLHNWTWQGLTIGEPNPTYFPKGISDVVRMQHCYEANGLEFRLHGFGGIFMARDTKYGAPALEKNLAAGGLAIAARGTAVEHVDPDQATFLLKPDLTLYPWLKPGMPPYCQPPPWGQSSSGYGATFPPYYEGNHSSIAFQGKVRGYRCEVTKDNLWKITLDSWAGAARHEGIRKGETLHFIVNGTRSWMVPDPRSDMYVEMADDYSYILNRFKSGPVYDGAGWSEPLGTWGLRKMVQMVYERLDHPVQGHAHFGFTDQKFRRVQQAEGQRPGSMSLMTGGQAALSSSVDDAHQSLTDKVLSKDIYVRGNHKGIEVSSSEQHGAWDEMMDALRIWSDLKPHLSDDLKRQIAKRYEKVRNTRKDIYVASETDDTWQLTKMRAMHRDGIDATWKLIPERPSVSTRQYLRADGQLIEGLGNPYVAQVPEMELHVMASMSSRADENLKLMPVVPSDLEMPGKGSQKLRVAGGGLTLSYDNSRSEKEAVTYFKSGKDTIPHWLTQSIRGTRFVNLEAHRGVSITVDGDGSGAVLLFSYGAGFPRSFAIDIDFTGRRTFEFPCGEMINNRYDWDTFSGQTITSFGYSRIDRFQLYFNRVPAGKKVAVRILDIRALAEERETGLVEPVLNLNGARAKVQGTIPYNHYLRYSGGTNARVYDQDWHFVKELPVVFKGKLKAVTGDNTFSVSAPRSPDAWLSARIKVRDLENIITVMKPEL
jgi:hypothetical protein